MEVEAHWGGVELIEQLTEEWRALCNEGPSNNPFARPEWFAVHVRWLLPHRPLLVLTARAGGRLRGMLPLIAEKDEMYGVTVRRLRSAVDHLHGPRFDMIHGAGSDRTRLAKAIWDHLKAMPGWDLLELRDVPQEGAAVELTAAAERDSYLTGYWQSFRTPYIFLPGDFQQVLAQTHAKFRANLRRRRAKLETLGPVRLMWTGRVELRPLRHFLELEDAGWKGSQGSAILREPRLVDFYGELAHQAERFGYLSLYTLECGQRTVAAQYGLMFHGRYFLLKTAYDETLKECSPGQLLMQEVLHDCVHRGLREFDFLGASASWKTEWTSLVRPHVWCYVFNLGLRGRVLHAVKFRLAPLKQRLWSRSRG